jgi:hypothetical protein
VAGNATTQRPVPVPEGLLPLVAAAWPDGVGAGPAYTRVPTSASQVNLKLDQWLLPVTVVAAPPGPGIPGQSWSIYAEYLSYTAPPAAQSYFALVDTTSGSRAGLRLAATSGQMLWSTWNEAGGRVMVVGSIAQKLTGGSPPLASRVLVTATATPAPTQALWVDGKLVASVAQVASWWAAGPLLGIEIGPDGTAPVISRTAAQLIEVVFFTRALTFVEAQQFWAIQPRGTAP